MRDKRYFSCWILEIFALTILCVGCNGSKPIAANASASTNPSSQFIHFQPSAGSIIRLEFDYPSDWVFSEEYQYPNTDLVTMGLIDPKMLTIPTFSAEEPFPLPSDYGRIFIDVEPLKNETLESRFESYKQAHKNTTWIKLLSEDQISIDGYDAKVLKFEIEPMDDNGYSATMYGESIYFVVNEMVYKIYFTLAQTERSGEFEQGYKHFLNSMKILEE